MGRTQSWHLLPETSQCQALLPEALLGSALGPCSAPCGCLTHRLTGLPGLPSALGNTRQLEPRSGRASWDPLLPLLSHHWTDLSPAVQVIVGRQWRPYPQVPTPQMLGRWCCPARAPPKGTAAKERSRLHKVCSALLPGSWALKEVVKGVPGAAITAPGSCLGPRLSCRLGG